MQSSARLRFIAICTSSALMGAALVAQPVVAARVIKPGKVVSAKVTVANKALTATWAKGTGGAPSSYIATLTPGNKKCTTTRTTCTFSALTNGTVYKISIVARNSAGSSVAVVVSGTPKAPIPSPSPSKNAFRTLNVTGTLAGKLTEGETTQECDSYSVQPNVSIAASNPVCTLRVIAILQNGQMFTSSSSTNSKSFSISIAGNSSDQANLTLHIVRANGAYVGPVLLKASDGTTGLSSVATTTTATAAVGTISLATVDVNPDVKVTENQTSYGTAASVSTALLGSLKVRVSGGAPVGAGKAGFVVNSTSPKFKFNALVRSHSGVAYGTAPVASPTSSANPCDNLGPATAVKFSQSCFTDLVTRMSQEPKMSSMVDGFKTACSGQIDKTWDQIFAVSNLSGKGCQTVLTQIAGMTGSADCVNFQPGSGSPLTKACLDGVTAMLTNQGKADLAATITTSCTPVIGKTWDQIASTNQSCASGLSQAFNSQGGGSDPCANLGKDQSGTFTTDCFNMLDERLAKDSNAASARKQFNDACKSIAGNQSATVTWIQTNAPTCFSILSQLMSNGGGTGQGPCPNFGKGLSGTLTADCKSNIESMLNSNPNAVQLKADFMSKCGPVAGNAKATWDWIVGSAPDCLNVLNQVFNSGGNNGGGGNSGGQDECAAQGVGSDEDKDGIPNAIDVDDNGDLVIDAADPKANNQCSIEPMKGIWTSIDNPLNYGLVGLSGGTYSGSDFASSIDEYLSGANFGIGYYVHNTRFFPDAYVTSSGEMPAVWVNCDGVLWCDPKTSRAIMGGVVEQTNADGATGCDPSGFFNYSCNRPFNQPDYFGGTAGFADSKCGNVTDPKDRAHDTPCWSEIKAPLSFGNADNINCQVNKFNPDYALPAGLTLPAGASNFFWRQSCQMEVQAGTKILRTVMGAGISPQLNKLDPEVRADAMAQDILSPFNVLSLRYFNKSGGISSVATTLGAYPISGPLVRSVEQGGVTTTVDYGATGVGVELPVGSSGYGSGSNTPHALVIQPGQKLTVTFNRPQRVAFPGEDASTGFHDVHGLSYGLEFNLKNMQLGCGASKGNPEMGGAEFVSSYDTPSSDFTINSSLDSGANNLAPLRDAVVDAPDRQPASSTLTFTLDIIKCFQDRADLMASIFNKTGSSFASGSDVLKTMELPDGVPTDGTASRWMETTGMPTNGDTTCINMNLNGRSEAKTGGTDSSLQQICIQFAPGSLVPKNQPSTFKARNFGSGIVGYLKKAQFIALNTP